jgi:hypothetical protein
VITDTDIEKFTSFEKAFRQVLVDHLLVNDEPVQPNLIGRDFRYDTSMPYFIRLEKVPGGRTDRFGGTVIIDVETWGTSYNATDSLASAIESVMLGYPHVVEVDGRKVVLDEVFQNTGAAALPWEADSVFRLGATYVLTARR